MLHPLIYCIHTVTETCTIEQYSFKEYTTIICIGQNIYKQDYGLNLTSFRPESCLFANHSSYDGIIMGFTFV